jgi:hypothetical protein
MWPVAPGGLKESSRPQHAPEGATGMAPSNSYRRRQPAAVVVSAGTVVVTPPSAGSVGSAGSPLSQAATANARVIAAAIVFVLRSIRSICPPFQGHVSPGPPDAHATRTPSTPVGQVLNRVFVFCHLSLRCRRHRPGSSHPCRRKPHRIRGTRQGRPLPEALPSARWDACRQSHSASQRPGSPPAAVC